ncbi:unnamed protein product [Bemisia tabaci]|uniref:Adipose-secreted signaling protein n=1 Tax=Bemisia tabaci TaxID=7038 RepID=A0A9P0A411_BEMTA|nr:PREDICTED: UPF0687 protein C20orf27 homolog [Bemisia tabaci]CAH0383778.1 unnamed protein product [Bemisia tabaci]
MTANKEHHHVHFNEGNDTFGRDNEIIIKPGAEPNIFQIHLGFLQINHRYAISFSSSKTMMRVKDGAKLVPVSPTVPNFNCTFSKIEVDANQVNFFVELFAHKEKLLKEELAFQMNNEGDKTILQLTARVLGKGKGTPLLKDNIHCIGVEQDEDESEASDWQGFPEG